MRAGRETRVDSEENKSTNRCAEDCNPRLIDKEHAAFAIRVQQFYRSVGPLSRWVEGVEHGYTRSDRMGHHLLHSRFFALVPKGGVQQHESASEKKGTHDESSVLGTVRTDNGKLIIKHDTSGYRSNHRPSEL